ncbi:DUF1709-domain-containing protein [Suhomyces tanzawaensis NRRL Y-17324]|uniref:DUF1709-domain-containing protein n=1 Tax=Suhomyces tanzawaensis NRRL Y-17324 TaxID=984487 RepID=A0A1E4SGN6_9ASCO|nr:DUF1709-domain-containing protein [Suhomyces tanzawaensis NRRL Y-17324]ODV78673.1 DUF1709-domain-containing protein [Suhomyces tanzawaensis NRRL Y-17324]
MTLDTEKHPLLHASAGSSPALTPKHQSPKGLHEATSLNNSPTKPLNFPRFPAKNQPESAKECNSSSDTYISDESPEHKSVKSSELDKDTLDFSSLERNFNIDPLGAQATIGAAGMSHAKPSEDEFSFATPLTSTTDLSNPNPASDKTVSKYINTSPSKSIMKKTPAASPKKNVVFTNSNPEIHHYKDTSPDTSHPDSDKLDPTTPEKSAAISHDWNELSTKSPFSDDDGSLPPPPPPHSSNSFQDLLRNVGSEKKDHEDLDLSTLTDLKLKHSSYSNLSLNEKLDLFLTNNTNHQIPRLNGSKSFAELDAQLSSLNDATKYKTDSNIHYLSLSLQNPKSDIENPLESLVQSSEVQLRSSGSSQSSLQSLKDTNRTLESIHDSVSNKGIELNDGIKGFSDTVAELIIPLTNDKTKAPESPRVKRSGSANRIQDLKHESEEEEFHDSFDKSYNSTEKSIMNLLNSASSHDLHENLGDTIEKPIKSEVQDIKQEQDVPVHQVKVKVEEALPIRIKEENDFGTVPLASTESLAPPVKREMEDDSPVRSEFDHHFETVDDKVKTVHNSEQASLPVKLVKSVVRNGDESKMSIRFQMDKDWKLEDSHDGDREDNDSYTNNDLTISSIHSKKIDFEKMKTESLLESDSSSIDIDDKQEAKEVKLKTEEEEEAEEEEEEKEKEEEEVPTVSDVSNSEQETLEKGIEKKDVDDSHDEQEFLANSSNIAPQADITLPPIETNTFSSFEDITNTRNDSYEESLSAEHDVESRPTNFISIWHSQDKERVHPIKRADEFFKVAKEDLKVEEPKETKLDKFKLPPSLQPKKFKEVNVMSRRVVSPEFDDLNVTDFLPEISEDSGFENHFKFLKQGNSTINYSDAVGNRNSFTPLSTKNVLTNIDDPDIIEPPLPSTSLRPGVKSANLQPQQFSSQFKVSRPANLQPHFKTRIRKSKFKVPSFEIKRSSSILSPRDTYNDIFDDVLKEPPTIKASGMKTLPSMDRDDVKRIMSAKKVLTQEEYSKVKLGQSSKKHSVVNLPVQAFDELQQHASICDTSMDTNQEDVLPHLATELSRRPEALLSKDQFFHDYDIFSTQFPDPDPELIGSPTIFKTPPKELTYNNDEEDISEEIKMKYQFLNSMSPTKNFTVSKSPSASPKSPKKANVIKIGAPMGLVKRGSTVVAVTPSSPKKPKTFSDELDTPGVPARAGLVNNKLRELKFKPSESQAPPKVATSPSIFNDSTNINNNGQETTGVTLETQVPEPAETTRNTASPSQERGKLFFRVVGLKNLNLPDIAKHNGKFSLTLDNGVHSIRTANYSLNSTSIVIGKEFELIVGSSLEFILTMKITYDKPKGGYREVRERKVVKSANRFSRFFGSKDVMTLTKVVPVEPHDSWANKFAQDGSFGRCYVDLDQYEKSITCKAQNFDLTCFNEWETTTNSEGKIQSVKPYVVGNLEVKMLFVPRTDQHEILPTSIKSAYESIDDLQDESSQSFEGYLFQDGGDCDTWKRRFFKLKGTSLIAHSEFSHKTRAKINLAKVVEVIYVDKENIHKSSINYRNFSDVMLFDNAFKIRFANGEIIDFGAQNKYEKQEWITTIERIVYRNKFRRQPWVKAMLSESQ